MKKKRILFILHLPPPVHGAAMVGKYIQESKVICEHFETHYINLSTSTAINHVGKTGIGKFLKLILLQIHVLKMLLTNKYDLCYLTLTSTGPGFYKDFTIVFLVKLFGIKIIYHFHNKGIANNKKKIAGFLYRYCFHNTKSILLSNHLKKDIENYVKDNNIFICPNGIPFEKKTSAIIKNTDPDKPCCFLFLSNMMEEKGVFLLLEACQQLAAKYKSFTCHFAGPWADITEETFNDKVKKMGLLNKVTYHGKKYGAEKEELFMLADVFVFPTYYHNECFPLVLLEAMKFQLPVISTFEGGIPDIIDDTETGYLIQQKNLIQLAEKMELMINNSKHRVLLGRRGFEKYREQFMLEKFEKRITEILKAVS